MTAIAACSPSPATARKPIPAPGSTGRTSSPPIVAAARDLGLGSALIDGEIVALDRDGRPSFQALQNDAQGRRRRSTFFAFDLLEQDGEDLTGLANRERKARLEALLAGAQEPIRYADHIVGEGEKLFDTLCKAGYEGVISKRADAPYRGRRSQSWLKIKCIRRQEFVIVGWTPSEKGRGFRSLLLGLYEEGKLRYAGKVGTGFGADGHRGADGEARPRSNARTPPSMRPAPPCAARIGSSRSSSPRSPSPNSPATACCAIRASSACARTSRPPTSSRKSPSPSPKAKKAKPAAGKPDDKPFGVAISSRERVIFPESGITKGELADYYAIVAAPMLAWLGRSPGQPRPLPAGPRQHCFFQKHDAGSFGDKVKKVPIREKDGHEEPYLYVDDPLGLMACVQMGTIEFHGWGAKVADVEKVDRMVFDLDPDEGLGFPAVKKAAVFLRGVLADIGLVSFPMLSGGKGVHVVVPLDATRRLGGGQGFRQPLRQGARRRRTRTCSPPT